MIETLSEPIAITATAVVPTTRTFLPYFEGLRGFLSLIVGLTHLWYMLSMLRPAAFPLPAHFSAIGYSTVAVFVVTSGYVLGLPVARAAQTFAGGLRTYARRRALRILPAYYAALLLSMPISTFCASVFHEGLTKHQFFISALLHLFMLQNVSNRLLASIDGPMWSIAMECDIYLLFPLLLVPFARRFGFVPMVASAFAVGLVPALIGALRHHITDYHFAYTSPWYIGMFALGYAAANLSVDPDAITVRRFERWPWGLLAVIFTAAMLVAVASTTHQSYQKPLSDILIGLAIAAQFTANARARKRGRTTRFAHFCSWRPFLFLGTFSYSYILIHIPIMELVLAAVRASWTNTQVLSAAAVALLAGLLAAYVFYRFIERRFLTAYRRRGDEASLRSTRVLEITDAGQVAAASGHAA
jgi:peptidoglycan/LPS O-acetylase OafA/YrhL